RRIRLTQIGDLNQAEDISPLGPPSLPDPATQNQHSGEKIGRTMNPPTVKKRPSTDKHPCAIRTARKKKVPSQPPILTDHTLPKNIPVWDSPDYWENTCRVLAPNQSYPQGKILLHPGQPSDGSYLQSVISRPIYDASGKIDFDILSSVKQDLPNPGWIG